MDSSIALCSAMRFCFPYFESVIRYIKFSGYYTLLVGQSFYDYQIFFLFHLILLVLISNLSDNIILFLFISIYLIHRSFFPNSFLSFFCLYYFVFVLYYSMREKTESDNDFYHFCEYFPNCVNITLFVSFFPFHSVSSVWITLGNFILQWKSVGWGRSERQGEHWSLMSFRKNKKFLLLEF